MEVWARTVGKKLVNWIGIVKNRMFSIASAFKALCLSLLFVAVVASRPTNRPKVFNVQRYGAKADGKTDNAKGPSLTALHGTNPNPSNYESSLTP
ncbi:hypothetical protein YC2023_044589 [Brassica napus]